MNVENKKISFNTIILAISYWLVLVTLDGSFTVQTIIPLLLLLILHTIINHKTVFQINKEHKTFILLLSIMSISTILNCIMYTKYASLDSLIGLLYFIIIFLWFYFLTSKNYTAKEIKIIQKSYVIVCLICSLMLIRQYLNGQGGKIYLINFLGIEVDENHLSAFMLPSLVFMINSILYNKNSTLKKKILYLLVFSICLFGIILTGSRAAFLCIVSTLILSFCIFFFKNFSIKKLLYSIFILLIAGIIGAKIYNYIPKWTIDRFVNNSYADTSNAGRIELWKNAIRGISKKPIFGYSFRFFDKFESFKYLSNGEEIPKVVPAHQTYLDVAIFSGLLGLLTFVYLIWQIFKSFFKKENLSFLPLLIILLIITILSNYVVTENNSIEEIYL